MMGETIHQQIRRLLHDSRLTDQQREDLGVARRRLRRGRLYDASLIANDVEDQLKKS